MGLNVNYTHKPTIGFVQISAANANRDGTGTVPTVATAGPIGTKIERVIIQAISTTTAGMVRLFLHDGAANRLVSEVPVAAISPSATVQAFRAEVDFSTPDKLQPLPATWSLRASTEKAETFNVFAIGGDLGVA